MEGLKRILDLLSPVQEDVIQSLRQDLLVGQRRSSRRLRRGLHRALPLGLLRLGVVVEEGAGGLVQMLLPAGGEIIIACLHGCGTHREGKESLCCEHQVNVTMALRSLTLGGSVQVSVQ
jgi:hypothetical protein